MADDGTDVIEVRCTTPDRASALRLARLLVDERLAACVQVIPGVTSVYRWEDEVEQDDEYLILAKSTSQLFEPIRRRIVTEHPYDTPEVLAVAVTAGDVGYTRWLHGAVSPNEGAARSREAD
ncbi:divalent-cation tolerance protein CutA [Phycicoccus sp. CSK15P-2]|uniref:divalent-cation tolerance protein CutA n=1 Tax=Phycicoccus sp. CSK15P-2 TaxID=2807627 RepID=UPI00194F9590|nr:divalent-cation tolerance protein CutA [Phycicoccus sp. CSK15P-2]MBM6403337.1 divalent-cation tolerance protein CutA [Phycicoccus sp. CSK15P-2]